MEKIKYPIGLSYKIFAFQIHLGKNKLIILKAHQRVRWCGDQLKPAYATSDTVWKDDTQVADLQG